MTLPRLIYITQDREDISHLDQIKKACLAGIKFIQLRIKEVPNDFEQLGKACVETAHQHGAILLFNDHVNMAARCGADGVHVGQSDMSVLEARSILGDKIIGGTANNLDHITSLNEQGTDYIGLGPYRFTSTKKHLSPILGLKGIGDLCKTTSKPIYAIGGIQQDDVPLLRDQGAYGVAVSQGITEALDFQSEIDRFLNNSELVQENH